MDGIRERDPIGGAAFCEALMQEEGVALVPGSAFGDDRWVRLSYAASDRVIATGLDRLMRFIDRLASVPAATSK